MWPALIIRDRTIAEADDSLPDRVGEPVIVRREECGYNVLMKCDADAEMCFETVDLTYGKANKSDSEACRTATGICGNDFEQFQWESGC